LELISLAGIPSVTSDVRREFDRPDLIDPAPDGAPKVQRLQTFRLRGFFKTLGPGLITGASDDDPSGIGTYR
jgi:hypothetical protein